MGDKVSVALVGICGYGGHHLGTVLELHKEGALYFRAAVARRPERCRKLDELKATGAVIYPSLEDFYRQSGADLVIISSPIHLHRQQTCLALEHGSNVLCEKPVAATAQEASAMAEAERRSGRFVAIGYQWSFSDAIQALKDDILAGQLGRPIRLRTFVSWPRRSAYFTERSWAGVVKSDDGGWILDSPAMNATAHYLHNCLYVLGRNTDSSATPVDVQAELYRANRIENYDTAAMRVHTDEGTEILFYTSHAVPSAIGPLMSYQFERATVGYESSAGHTFIARFPNGRTKVYGSPDASGKKLILEQLRCIREGSRPLCGIAAASAHTLCVDGAQESVPAVATFPDSLIKKEGEQNPLTFVEGLQGVMAHCYDQGILPAEHGAVTWARAGRLVGLRGYAYYPGGKPPDGP